MAGKSNGSLVVHCGVMLLTRTEFEWTSSDRLFILSSTHLTLNKYKRYNYYSFTIIIHMGCTTDPIIVCNTLLLDV